MELLTEKVLLKFAKERVERLSDEINRMRDYLYLKFEQHDHHAIADAAMDIRELEAERRVYENLLKW